jgi:hypothetical protein
VADPEHVELTDHEILEMLTTLHICTDLERKVCTRLSRRMIDLKVHPRPPEILALKERLSDASLTICSVHDALLEILNQRMDEAEEG